MFVRHSHIKHYSDVSTFDHANGIYIASGEVNSTRDSANFQNLERMLGLWRSNQKFILGWSINLVHIHCRIKWAVLHLYQLQETNDISGIPCLAELYLASILIVDSIWLHYHRNNVIVASSIIASRIAWACMMHRVACRLLNDVICLICYSQLLHKCNIFLPSLKGNQCSGLL